MAVDGHEGYRLAYQVLDHDPNEEEMNRFFVHVKDRLSVYGRTVRGITTDGSALYPTVIGRRFPDAPHQVCVFHILQEINELVIRIFMSVRRGLRKRKSFPRRGRGRPRRSEALQVRQEKQWKNYIHVLYEHRRLWVQKHLTATERMTVRTLSRGHPLLKTLRDLVDAVYALFDRRCSTDTADLDSTVFASLDSSDASPNWRRSTKRYFTRTRIDP